jgi:WD40 repeat protein
VTVGDDKVARQWSAGNGQPERALPAAPVPLSAVALARNGGLLATGGADQKVRLYNFGDLRELATLDAPGPVRGLAFSPNSQALIAACAEQALAAWNVIYAPGQTPPADFGKPLQRFAAAGGATDVVVAADNATFYSVGQDKNARAWKLAADVPVRNFAHPNFVDAAAFHPNGGQLATGCHDGILRIYDLAKNAVVRQINAHTQPTPSPIYAVAWTPDGKAVLSGSLDRSLKLWDAGTGNLIREFKGYHEMDFPRGHRDAVFCATFNADGKLLATGGSDRAIKLWNVADGSVVREFRNPAFSAAMDGPAVAHPGWVYGLRFTADGKYLVSAGNAPKNHGYLAVWAVADGKLHYGHELPLGSFHALALSPDGKSIALACGPQQRPYQEVSAYVLKMPAAVK